MALIHVVMGMTGEYEDRHKWPVLAFHSKRKASSYAKRATAQAAAAFAALDNKYDCGDIKSIPLDPHIDVDYTGTTYHVMSVQIGG